MPMCKYGDYVSVPVKIPADLSHIGKEVWTVKSIDRCLSDIVLALGVAGIVMRSSCCGHGMGHGEIVLEDGRILVIKRPKEHNANE